MAGAEMSTPLIELRAVTKTYGEGQAAFQALRGVDLAIARGDFVAVMGPSGSGKSTAMNLLGCLDTASSGEYLFQGTPVLLKIAVEKQSNFSALASMVILMVYLMSSFVLSEIFKSFY